LPGYDANEFLCAILHDEQLPNVHLPEEKMNFNYGVLLGH